MISNSGIDRVKNAASMNKVSNYRNVHIVETLILRYLNKETKYAFVNTGVKFEAWGIKCGFLQNFIFKFPYFRLLK